MGGDRLLDARALVPRKSWKLAVFISLRHGSSPLDFSFADRQRPSKNSCQRDLALRRLGCNQRNGYMAISLDRPNPALAMDSVAGRDGPLGRGVKKL